MEDEKLMTVAEFNVHVSKWALQIARKSRQTLRSETHGSGRLANWLSKFVDKKNDSEPAYKVKFQFDRYGVFRAYGAGRGYVIYNGQIVKGRRVRSVKDIQLKRFSEEARQEFIRGATVREINSMKKYQLGDMTIMRSRLDWIDVHVTDGIGQLADLCQEFYGDKAAEQILKYLDDITIVKKP